MRKFAVINTGIYRRGELCFFTRRPLNYGNQSYRYATGKTIKRVPGKAAEFHMEDEEPGMKSGGFIGNTLLCLLVRKAIGGILAAGAPAKHKVQLVPARIFNHQKHLHSDDYVIVNPIGTIDCIERQKSGITYSARGTGEIVEVDEQNITLVDERIPRGVRVFRLPECPNEYVIDCAVIPEIKRLAIDPLNLYLWHTRVI